MYWRQLSPSLQGQQLCLRIACPQPEWELSHFSGFFKKKKKEAFKKYSFTSSTEFKADAVPELCVINHNNKNQVALNCCRHLSLPLNADPQPFPSLALSAPTGFWGGGGSPLAQPGTARGAPAPVAPGKGSPGDPGSWPTCPRFAENAMTLAPSKNHRHTAPRSYIAWGRNAPEFIPTLNHA